MREVVCTTECPQVESNIADLQCGEPGAGSIIWSLIVYSNATSPLDSTFYVSQFILDK